MLNLNEKIKSLKLNSKQARGYNFLDRQTTEQRNRFLQGVIKYNNTLLEEKLMDALKGHQPRGYSRDEYKNEIKAEMNNSGLNYLKWLQEADKTFDAKLLTMVEKLEKFGFLDDNILLDTFNKEIGEGLSLEFYIRGFDVNTKQDAGRVHARLIWVECYEKESHYRFICTHKK